VQLWWHKKCVLGVHDVVVQILKSQKFLTLCRLFPASEFTKYGKIIHSLYMALAGNWKNIHWIWDFIKCRNNELRFDCILLSIIATQNLTPISVFTFVYSGEILWRLVWDPFEAGVIRDSAYKDHIRLTAYNTQFDQNVLSNLSG